MGPCAQAQGQGLTPAIRAGKGWRGRWELAPRRSATQLGACSSWFIDRDMFVIPSSEPQPPQPPPPPRPPRPPPPRPPRPPHSVAILAQVGSKPRGISVRLGLCPASVSFKQARSFETCWVFVCCFGMSKLLAITLVGEAPSLLSVNDWIFEFSSVLLV